MTSAEIDPEPQREDGPGASAAEMALVTALRASDEAAFAALVEQYHPALLRLARLYVASAEAAEEVVQETWLGVLNGLARFEGRASLKTWIFRILTNRARTRGVRDARSIPFSQAFDAATDPAEPAVPEERFIPPDHPQWARFVGHWRSVPPSWGDLPEQRLLAQETRRFLNEALVALPPSQREVITLRDIEGWSAGEVCNALGITETNQRVLLHRARSRIRRALEQYLTGA